MADISTRKRGSKWEYRFEIASVGGKRKQKSKGGFRTKAEALKAGREALTEYENTGKSFSPSTMSFSDCLDEWLESYCKMNYENTTIENYEKIVRLHIKPQLGEFHLSAIGTDDLQELINIKFKEGYSMNRLGTMKNVLSGCLKYAKRMKYIKYNPIHDVELPSQRAVKKNSKTRKKERTPIPKEIMQKILERFPEGTPYHIPLILGYKAGLRIGECYAITWNDIDLETGILSITKQVQMDESEKKWTFHAPKYGSAREIPLDDETLKLLRREDVRQKQAILQYGMYRRKIYLSSQNQLNYDGDGNEIRLLMQREDGTYIQPRTMQHCSRIIHGKYKGCDVIWPAFDYHSLRHTHATELADAGATAKEIQARLGHKKIETTLNTYTHFTEDTKERTKAIINKMYG